MSGLNISPYFPFRRVRVTDQRFLLVSAMEQID